MAISIKSIKKLFRTQHSSKKTHPVQEASTIYSFVEDSEYHFAVMELLKRIQGKITGYEKIADFPAFKLFEYTARKKLKKEHYYLIEVREPGFLDNERIKLMLIKDNNETPANLYYEIIEQINDEMKKIIDYNKVIFDYRSIKKNIVDGDEEYILAKKQSLATYYIKDSCIREGKKEEMSISIKVDNNPYEISVFKLSESCYKLDFDNVIKIYSDLLSKRYQNVYEI